MTAGSPEEDSDDDEVPQSTLLRLRRPMGLGLTQQNAVSEVIAETHSAALISGAPLSPGDRILRIDGISVEDYARVKLKEEDYQKSLDLGAWGPRFKKTAAPGAFDKAWLASFWFGAQSPNRPRTKKKGRN